MVKLSEHSLLLLTAAQLKQLTSTWHHDAASRTAVLTINKSNQFGGTIEYFRRCVVFEGEDECWWSAGTKREAEVADKL